MVIAQVILWAVASYAGIGLAFAAYFVTLGLGGIDSAARGAPVGVRFILAPGAAALWPLLTLLRTCRLSASR